MESMDSLRDAAPWLVVVVLMCALVVANSTNSTSNATSHSEPSFGAHADAGVLANVVGHTIYPWRGYAGSSVDYPGIAYDGATVQCSYAASDGRTLSYQQELEGSCKNREGWKSAAIQHCVRECSSTVKSLCRLNKVVGYTPCDDRADQDSGLVAGIE